MTPAACPSGRWEEIETIGHFVHAHRFTSGGASPLGAARHKVYAGVTAASVTHIVYAKTNRINSGASTLSFSFPSRQQRRQMRKCVHNWQVRRGTLGGCLRLPREIVASARLRDVERRALPYLGVSLMAKPRYFMRDLPCGQSGRRRARQEARLLKPQPVVTQGDSPLRRCTFARSAHEPRQVSLLAGLVYANAPIQGIAPGEVLSA
ncbi:hypothetical protein MRX96_023310 [Rhipicephalus microplus]